MMHSRTELNYSRDSSLFVPTDAKRRSVGPDDPGAAELMRGEGHLPVNDRTTIQDEWR